MIATADARDLALALKPLEQHHRADGLGELSQTMTRLLAGARAVSDLSRLEPTKLGVIRPTSGRSQRCATRRAL
jgi:hypothetical protein